MTTPTVMAMGPATTVTGHIITAVDLITAGHIIMVAGIIGLTRLPGPCLLIPQALVSQRSRPRGYSAELHAIQRRDVLIAGVAGLVAGAMSMAAGEYVSVSSQSDTEKADLARERRELSEDPQAEHKELAEIYVKRGIDRTTAQQVSRQLMASDVLAAHARDELGISEITTARPVQAALTSAVMFSVGGGHAVADGRGLSRQCACPGRLCRIIGLSGPVGSYRRKGRRRKHAARDDPSNVLGSSGARCHGWNRQAFWGDSLKPGRRKEAHS
jgi:hypothetical protein